MNLNWNSLEGVGRHLLIIGISPYYTKWVYHGESLSFTGAKNFEEVTLLMKELVVDNLMKKMICLVC